MVVILFNALVSLKVFMKPLCDRIELPLLMMEESPIGPNSVASLKHSNQSSTILHPVSIVPFSHTSKPKPWLTKGLLWRIL